MNIIKNAAGPVAVLVVIGLAYGGWLIKREINYSWDYESKVKETIQEQIKPLEQRIKVLEDKKDK